MKRKRIENLNRILQLIISVILGAVMLTGCTDDPFESNKGKPVDQTGVPEGFVRARVNMIAADFEDVRTKSLSNQQEHDWTHVAVGQFNANGELVASSVKQYVPLDESGNFLMDLEVSGGANNLVYFITNYGDKGGNMGELKNNPFIDPETSALVENLERFKELIYTPDSTDNASIAAGDKLVMVGSINMVVSEAETPISTILVYVDKLTAKLDVKIEASQSISTPSHPFIGATLSITGLQIVNVPKHVAFAEDGDKIADPNNLAIVKAELEDKGGALVKNYNTLKSYYILENRMHDAEAIHPNDPAEKGKEQFKNQAAVDHGIDNLATYMLIEGQMNDGRNVGKVTWKIYLGENNVDNFNIRRNTHYTVTVKIDGAGIATSDIRVDRKNLVVRELRWLNGRYGSSRSPETSYLDPNDTNWGNRETPAIVNSNDYLYMDAGNGTWGFELTGQNNTALPAWPGLSVSYLPLLKDDIKDPGTNANMGGDEIRSKWVEDIESNWKLVNATSATQLPSGVRVRVNVGKNSMLVNRTVDFNYFNDDEPNQRRVWRITQYATDQITLLSDNFFPSEAGIYGVMVRATEGSYWRLESAGSGLTFKGVVKPDGTIAQEALATDSVTGHGIILFKVGNYTGTPKITRSITVKSFESNPEDGTPLFSEKTVSIHQMASAENLIKTKGLTTGRYVYDYTTDPLYETLYAINTQIPMGINLVDNGRDYDKDESKYGAWSSTNGKENTFKIFKALEGYVAGQFEFPNQTMKAPPVFSPAGICMMMNEEWWDIEDVTDSRLQWYLPARFQGLMGATAVMLGVKGLGYASASVPSANRGTFWTSTMPRTTPADVRSSGYFAGTTVDVSANYSATSTVRCVRDNKNVTKTYPYLANVNGNPVIVSQERVDGELKGYVDVDQAPSGNHEYYRLGRPLRFTERNQISDVSGEGPSDPNWSYLSPRFRVAKRDAVVVGSEINGTWVQASGWSNANAVDIATPATGCAAYSEPGSTTGWRLPSELEMRQILLLGGGIGSITNVDGGPIVPDLQKGGTSFTEFSDFEHLGGTSGRAYWVNRKYPNDNRSVYLRVTNDWANAIGGSAVAWTSVYFVRCVRDM